MVEKIVWTVWTNRQTLILVVTDSPSTSPSRKATRRSERFPSVVPIEARWQEQGRGVLESGQAVEANAHGGVLKLARYPQVAQIIEIINRLSGESIEARVLAERCATDGSVRGIAVEFVWPHDSFWGLSYRLQRTSAELMRLDEVLRDGKIDLRVLRDFRDAVDYVRKTSWAVYEWHDRQLRQRDTATVLPLLTRERIRRATKLCGDVAQELESGNLNDHLVEIADLQKVLERLTQLLATRPAPIPNR